jgi:hypothetical protein
MSRPRRESKGRAPAPNRWVVLAALSSLIKAVIAAVKWAHEVFGDGADPGHLG